MIRGKTIVDLCTHPSFAWIVYLDGERLLMESETTKIREVGTEVRALTKEAEAVAAAAHAIYKEHMYLLSDHYVIKRWMNSKVLSLARELGAEDSIKVALDLNEQIGKGCVDTPVKLSPLQTMRTLARKFVKDPHFRATSVNALKLVPRRRTMQQLIHRTKREAY